MAKYNEKKNCYGCEVTFNNLGFNSHKEAYIALRKALSDLKRGKPSDYSLEVLGCSIEQFHSVNQYITANEQQVKQRASYIKDLEGKGSIHIYSD